MKDSLGHVYNRTYSQEEMYNAALERNKLMKQLESLTPGGSEFYNDPEACVEYVKRVIAGIPGIILPLKIRIKDLEEENKQLKTENG